MGIVPIMATYGAPSSASAEAVNMGYQIEPRDLPPGDIKTTGQKEFRLPLSYFEDGEKYNPSQEIKKFTKPKLLICGTQDEFTRSERVKEVYDSLTGPKMFLELNTNHDYRYHSDMIQKVNETVDKLLDEYLAGNTP